MYTLLKKLCDLHGPSGFEQEVIRAIFNEIENDIDDYQIDSMGNLVVRKKATDNNFPSLLLVAHTDEVGFIVRGIESNGLILFEKLGGIEDRILLAQPVLIKTENGNVNGVIGTRSAHYVKWDSSSNIPPYNNMYIDIGATSRSEVIEKGINIGQSISFGSKLKKIENNQVVGKALDNRVGCLILIMLLKYLKSHDVKHGDLVISFTVQEEIGLRGAAVLSSNYNTDYALSVDTTPISEAGGIPNIDGRTIGKGPCIKVADNSIISNPVITNLLKIAAEEINIPYQLEVFMGIYSDIGAIHNSNKGISSGAVSIPSKYTHSPIEIVSLEDIDNTFKLLRKFILSLNLLKDKNFLNYRF